MLSWLLLLIVVVDDDDYDSNERTQEAEEGMRGQRMRVYQTRVVAYVPLWFALWLAVLVSFFPSVCLFFYKLSGLLAFGGDAHGNVLSLCPGDSLSLCLVSLLFFLRLYHSISLLRFVPIFVAGGWHLEADGTVHVRPPATSMCLDFSTSICFSSLCGSLLAVFPSLIFFSSHSITRNNF